MNDDEDKGNLSLMSIGLLGLQSFDSCRLPALGDTCNTKGKFLTFAAKFIFNKLAGDTILFIVDGTILQKMPFKDDKLTPGQMGWCLISDLFPLSHPTNIL